MTDSNIPVSSPGLYDAYVAWRDCKEDTYGWATKTTSGLCGWMQDRWVFELTTNHLAELKAQLESSLRKGPCPFNTESPFTHGGSWEAYMAYSTESTQARCHRNPARIKWVNDRIADYEKHHKPSLSSESLAQPPKTCYQKPVTTKENPMTKPVYNAALVSKAATALLDIMEAAHSEKITDAVLDYSRHLDLNGPTKSLGDIAEGMAKLRSMSRGKLWLEAFDAFWGPVGKEIEETILNSRRGIAQIVANPEGNRSLVLAVADALPASKGLSATTKAHQAHVHSVASILRDHASDIRLDGMMEALDSLRDGSRVKRWRDPFDAYLEGIEKQVMAHLKKVRETPRAAPNPVYNESLVLEVADALLASKGLSATTRTHQTNVGNYASNLRRHAATICLDRMMEALNTLRDGSRVTRWRDPFDAYLTDLGVQVSYYQKKAKAQEAQKSSKAYQEMMDAADIGDEVLLSLTPDDKEPRKPYRVLGFRSMGGVTRELKLAEVGACVKVLNAHQLYELNAAFPPRKKSQARDDFESLQVGDVFRLDAFRHRPMPRWDADLKVSSVHRRNPRRLRVNFKDTTGKTQVISFLAWKYRNGRIVSRAHEGEWAPALFDDMKVGTVVRFTNLSYALPQNHSGDWVIERFETGMHGTRKIHLRSSNGATLSKGKNHWDVAHPIIVRRPDEKSSKPEDATHEAYNAADLFGTIEPGSVIRLTNPLYTKEPRLHGNLTVQDRVQRPAGGPLCVRLTNSEGGEITIPHTQWLDAQPVVVSPKPDFSGLDLVTTFKPEPTSILEAATMFDIIEPGTAVRLFAPQFNIPEHVFKGPLTVGALVYLGDNQVRSLFNAEGACMDLTKEGWIEAQPMVVSVPASDPQDPSHIPEAAKDRIMTAFTKQEVASSPLLGALALATAKLEDEKPKLGDWKVLNADTGLKMTSETLSAGDRFFLGRDWKGYRAGTVFLARDVGQSHVLFCMDAHPAPTSHRITYAKLTKLGARRIDPVDLATPETLDPNDKVILGTPTVLDLQRHIDLIMVTMGHRQKPEESYKRFMFCANDLIDIAGRGSKSVAKGKHLRILSRLAERLRDATIAYLADNPMTNEYAPETRAGLLLLAGLINPVWLEGCFDPSICILKDVEYLDSRYELEKTRPSDL